MGSEKKGADQLCAVNAQLNCTFVFTYVKSRCSHDAALMLH